MLLRAEEKISEIVKGPGGKRTADETGRVDKHAAVDARKLGERVVANSAPTVRNKPSAIQLD